MKVLVVGDTCDDVYVYGKCDRLSPEVPVPVFVPLREKKSGGMAKNVFNNLVSLGISCDLIGSEEEIHKIRYVDEKTNHVFLRVDKGESVVKRIQEKYMDRKFLSQYDAVVISDYNKGFLTEEDIEKICYHHPLTFMDTKKKLGRWCKDCTWIKINEPEFYETCNNIIELEHIFDDKLIVTLSERGCRYKNITYAVEKVEIKDLSGAGDTFLAAFVAEYVASQDVEKSIIFANECATEVVQLKGVNIVKKRT